MSGIDAVPTLHVHWAAVPSRMHLQGLHGLQVFEEKSSQVWLDPCEAERQMHSLDTLCIDPIDACPFGKKDPDPAKDTHVELHCMTMIDPATGWFEIVEIPTKRADCIAKILECHWLTRCPWPTPNYS